MPSITEEQVLTGKRNKRFDRFGDSSLSYITVYDTDGKKHIFETGQGAKEQGNYGR